MAKHQCDNSNGYSSPVPIIGLYIAAASLVCLLLMLWDIFYAIRSKARCIPCRLFSLNSVTLTLLAIVSKLPVDLTTNMPSARDQLSKLTGTTLTCICIGFMAPSVASNKRSESISNMASLSIFTVTVAVNICIQMGTGVVFSFVAEHIIIMCCMFMLLAILWYNTLALNKAALSKENVDHFQTIPWFESISLIHRVKRWYISTCINNPQLLLCISPLSAAVAPICIMCSLVLLQATYRSIVARTLEFCEGISDYGWSMWIIVITQSVTVIIGASTVAFRWQLATPSHWDAHFLSINGNELDDLKLQFSFMKRRSLTTSIMVLSKLIIKSVLSVFLIFIHAPMFVIALIVYWIFIKIIEQIARCCPSVCFLFSSPGGSWREVREEFEFKSPSRLSKRVIVLCVNNMKKWTNVKRDPPLYHHMVEMLSRRHRSAAPQLLNSFLRIGNSKETRYKMTCFSMVLLVKVVAAIAPSNPMAKSMKDTLHEAFEIVYYIDKKINVESTDTRKRHLAKLLWEGGDIDLSKVLTTNPNDPVGCAISKVEMASSILPRLPAFESMLITEYIKEQRYATIQKLCDGVEQLFSEMLQHFLAQLPICVFKEVDDSSIEDCEERARFITKLFCKLDSSLEDKVQWKFPDGWPANTSPIFGSAVVPPSRSDSHDTNAQNDASTEDGGSATAENVPTTTRHGIANAQSDISVTEDGGNIATAQNVPIEQVTEQQTDEIRATDASNNV